MTRQITSHIVNPANDLISVEVLDEPGHGGACHRYLVGSTDWEISFDFQNGLIAEAGVNGITHEVLLAILRDRLEGFQSGPYACEDNALALTYILGAQEALQRRTKARMERGVEGTHTI